MRESRWIVLAVATGVVAGVLSGVANFYGPEDEPVEMKILLEVEALGSIVDAAATAIDDSRARMLTCEAELAQAEDLLDRFKVPR